MGHDLFHDLPVSDSVELSYMKKNILKSLMLFTRTAT